MSFLLAVASNPSNASPLSGDQLVILAALIIVILWVLNFLEDPAVYRDEPRPRRVIGPGPKPR